MQRLSRIAGRAALAPTLPGVFAGGVGNVAFAAGRHDAIAFGRINGALCAALAEA